MEVKINGKDHKIRNNATIETVLKELSLWKEGMALACNDEIVHKQDFPKIILKQGDSLEIIHPVGGG